MKQKHKAVEKVPGIDGPLTAPLTVEEVARKIQYHPESVRRAIRQHRIKALKFGQDWRITVPEVRRILENGLPA